MLIFGAGVEILSQIERSSHVDKLVELASDVGITMSECRLFEENDRRHFRPRRFDRLDNGEKLNMQSLCALAHYDRNMAGAYAYEQALLAIKQLGLPMSAVEEQYRAGGIMRMKPVFPLFGAIGLNLHLA